MKLLEYLESLGGKSEIEDFAKSCGTSYMYLMHIARGTQDKKAGESLAINIERESEGVVRCEELRPDVDWQYIRSTAA